MKIALISEHASPLAVAGGVDSGGQNIYVAHLAREFVKAGHKVDVFTRRDKALLPDIVDFHGARVVHVPAGPPVQMPKESLLQYMDAFSAFVVKFASAEVVGYDVVHANFFMSGIAGMALQRALGVPLAVTFHALGKVRRLHQGANDGFPDARFEIEETLVRRADLIVAECPQDESDLITYYNADPTRLVTVPCGFDRTEMRQINRSLAKRTLNWRADEFAVLQLGRLVERKGIDTVIRALSRLTGAARQKARLYIVGGNSDAPNELATPEIGRLRRVALDEGVASSVTFVGRRGRDQLQWYYSAADAFVTTPWYEPFGITAIEAMACGTPTIGARVGGIQHSIVDGETGWLVPPKDPDALAARLMWLYEHPKAAAKAGQAGVARAYSTFTWQGVAEAMANAFQSIQRDGAEDGYSAIQMRATDESAEVHAVQGRSVAAESKVGNRALAG